MTMAQETSQAPTTRPSTCHSTVATRFPEDLANSIGDDAVYVVPQGPDHDPQSVLTFGQDGDPRIAVPEPADDLPSRKRGVKPTPFGHDLGDMIGHLGDIAPRAHAGDRRKLSDDLRGPGLPGAPFRVVVELEVAFHGGEQADDLLLADLHAAADAQVR